MQRMNTSMEDCFHHGIKIKVIAVFSSHNAEFFFLANDFISR